MKREDFEGWQGEGFQGRVNGEQVELVLKEIGALKPPPDGAPEFVRRDPFFLVFHGPADSGLEGETRQVVCPDGNEVLLSFNAEGYVDDVREKGMSYYVVVN